MDSFDSSFKSLSDSLKDLAFAIAAFESNQKVILSMDEVNIQKYEDVLNKIESKDNKKEIAQIDSMLSGLNHISSNLSHKSNEAHTKHISEVQTEIMQIYNSLRDELGKDEPEHLLVENHKSHLKNLLATQLKNFTRPPCMSKSDLQASNKAKIDQEFSKVAAKAIRVLDMVKALENPDTKAKSDVSKAIESESKEFEAMVESLTQTLTTMEPIYDATTRLIDYVENVFQ